MKVKHTQSSPCQGARASPMSINVPGPVSLPPPPRPPPLAQGRIPWIAAARRTTAERPRGGTPACAAAGGRCPSRYTFLMLDGKRHPARFPPASSLARTSWPAPQICLWPDAAASLPRLTALRGDGPSCFPYVQSDCAWRALQQRTKALNHFPWIFSHNMDAAVTQSGTENGVPSSHCPGLPHCHEGCHLPFALSLVL